MKNRIAIALLSLSSALMPLAAHAGGRNEFPRAQPVMVAPVYAQPVLGQRMHGEREGRFDRGERFEHREGRFDRDGRGDRDGRFDRAGRGDRDGRFDRDGRRDWGHARWQYGRR